MDAEPWEHGLPEVRPKEAHVKTVVAIVIVVLTCAAQAAAECGGWVLWRNSLPGESQIGNLIPLWEVESGAPDYKTCVAQMSQRVAFYLKHAPAGKTRRTLRGDLVQTFDSDGDLYEGSHFVCLPDTIDPRQSEKRTGGK